jgi:hypothetical protein
MAAGSGLTAAADLTITKTIIAASGGYGTTGANWVALYTTNFTAAAKAGAVEWTSASDTTYVRQAMGASGAGWTVGSYVSSTGVAFNNTNQIQFPGVSGNGQTLGSTGFCDALTAGNVNLFSDVNGTLPTVAIGIQVQFNATTDIIFTTF